MLKGLLASFVLLALCVVIHSGGIALILRQRHSRPPSIDHPWKVAAAIVQLAWKLTSLHLFQITLWAVYFRLQGCLPDFETALYFSGVSYSTLGYGDVVLPHDWRMMGPAEGMTGILMCGLSTGLFFAIAHDTIRARVGVLTAGHQAKSPGPPDSE